MGEPFLLGVAGGSGGGKTTVAERLTGLIGEPDLALVRQCSVESVIAPRPAAGRAGTATG